MRLSPRRLLFSALLLISSTLSAQTSGFTFTGSLNAPREWHTATLLNDGRVLVAGGFNDDINALATAEVYDPALHAFTATGSLNTARTNHAATLLQDGTVLIVGGYDADYNVLSSAELYNPATGTFINLGNMSSPRLLPTATLLFDGRVLIAGGQDANYNALATAEIYDPVQRTFTPTANMSTERAYSTATLLQDGTVVVIGGWNNAGDVLSSAEVYDPDLAEFFAVGSMQNARFVHSASLLNSGSVLVTGGFDANYNYSASSELYDMYQGEFTSTGGLTTGRIQHGTALLTNSQLFVVGGIDVNDITATTELYSPSTSSFSYGAPLLNGRDGASTTLLNDGTVLVAGGSLNRYNPSCSATAEIYQPLTLEPEGLVSITVYPTSMGLVAGNSQPYEADGNFADGSTQTLASVIWSSADTNIATVSNDHSNRGSVLAVGAGNTTITACAGSICGSAPLLVHAPTPSIGSFTPSSGGISTEVTITGLHFGSTPLPLYIGNVPMDISQWTDDTIKATVPTRAVTGMIWLQFEGTEIDAGTFTVTGKTMATPSVLSPKQVSMVVGETRTIDAFDLDGNVLTGLPWYSSDTNVVTLSTDDPPVLTAVAVGTATVQAGTSTATVTVFAGPELPEGTVKWTVPGDGTPILQTLPAVPSATGVADVFTLYQSGLVQAITNDGHVAWTVKTTDGPDILPDFTGGLLEAGDIVRAHDGVTGQALPPYTFTDWSYWSFGVHTDGTVFAGDGYSIVAIDPKTGQRKFAIPLQLGTGSSSYSDCSGNTSSNSWTNAPYYDVRRFTIAGDGYLYLAYGVENETATFQCTESKDGAGNLLNHSQTSTDSGQTELHLLRVGTDGSSTDQVIHAYPFSAATHETTERYIADYDQDLNPIYSYRHHYDTSSDGTGTQVDLNALTSGISQPLTDADTGVVLGWTDVGSASYSYTHDWDDQGHSTEGGTGPVTHPLMPKLTTVTGGAVAGTASVEKFVVPMLQREDGAFIGLGRVYLPGVTQTSVVAFDKTGNVLWSKDVPYFSTPLYALADGGVVYRDISYTNPEATVRLDANGNEIARVVETQKIPSWIGEQYVPELQLGSTDLPTYSLSYESQAFALQSIFQLNRAALAPSWAAVVAGNHSETGTAAQQEWFPELESCPIQPPNSPPCPKEAIRDALGKLRLKLITPCSDCSTNVFNRLGGNQKDFYGYLTRAPRLFDGSRSNAKTKVLCGLGSGLSGLSKWVFCRADIPSGTVAEYMSGALDDINHTPSSALSQTPSDKGEGIMIFFDPRIICNAVDGGAKQLLNEALLFHESLHGYYGVQDPQLETAFEETSNPGITYYLNQHIFGGTLLYLHDTPTDPEPMQCPN